MTRMTGEAACNLNRQTVCVPISNNNRHPDYESPSLSHPFHLTTACQPFPEHEKLILLFATTDFFS